MKRTVLKSMLLALVASLTAAQSALAYIDPNTGGMLFQALAAAFAVFSGVILIFSRQIRSILGKAKRSLGKSSADQKEPGIGTENEDV